MNAPSTSFAPAWREWRCSALVLAATTAVWWFCFRFPASWVLLGIGESNRPFLDLYSLLAAHDALRQGLSPLAPNPLDPYHRPFGFSSWWFAFEALGFGRKDVLWLGWGLLLSTLAAAVAMVRPKEWRSGITLWLLLVSPAVLIGVNRANQDLVIFLTVSLGLVCFRSAGLAMRILGVVLFAIAAVLKFFPLVTLVLLLEFRSRRQVLLGALAYGSVLLLAWPGLAPALRLLADKHAPAPDWLYAYGAPILARDLGILTPLAWLVPAVFVIGWAGWDAIRRAPAAPTVPVAPDDSAEREFICGAVMVVGIFFVGASYVYKLTFAIWMWPWLWRSRADHSAGRWARVIMRLLLGLAWIEGLAALILNGVTGLWSTAVALILLKTVLVIAQVLGWALVACLLRFLWAYSWRRGREWLGGPRQAAPENTLPGAAA